jgi:predicted ester cyclase
MPGVPKPMGRDDYLEGMKAGLRAFSDKSIAIEDEVVQGDKVVHRCKIELRHTGEFQGIPATNRSITFSSVWFYRVVENQVVEAWSLDQDFLKELR